MSRRHIAAAVLAICTVGAALLSGCTGVPTSSAPQVVVNKIGGPSQGGDLPITPPPDADPRTIVLDFLDAVATGNPHTAARGFLTPEARNRWQDATVTIVDDFTISNPVNGTVTVSAHKIGALSTTGVYTPDLAGDGTGVNPVTFSFAMTHASGQWRIESLPTGVLVRLNDFKRLYFQRELYYYDLAEQHLVPDPRYTAIVDPQLLADWLVTQLVGGPRPELQSAVTTEFPAQLDPARVTVALGAPSTVNLPGAGQLPATTRNRLAAQLAVTLVQVSSVNELALVDTGRPITIPQAGGTRFSAGEFQNAVSPPISTPALYYLHGGGVVDEHGHPLPGGVGNSTYGLVSAAVASSGSPDLRVAGVAGSGNSAQLYVGTVSTGLRRTAAVGRLSRPAWVPGLDEVWVGVGNTPRAVLRVGANDKPVPVLLSPSSGTLTGSVTALRLSPEGSRVAMVITAPDASAQVWVGSIVRNQAQVRVDSLEPITPSGIQITDVAWNGPLKLFVIGKTIATGDVNIYEVQVDGSQWTSRFVTNLPQAPDAITVAESEVAWVSAGGTVWMQAARSWSSPGTNGASGTNPVYLE